MLKIDERVVNVIEQLHKIWNTRIEMRANGRIVRSEIIKFKRGFFQGDALSPVGFCTTEIPLGIMLQRMPGYQMGPPNLREIKINRLYFIDDLKVIQSSETDLRMANELVGTISNDSGMKFGVSKCQEIVYNRGKMIRGFGMTLKEGEVRALDPSKSEYYTFLGVEEADGQMDRLAKERVNNKAFHCLQQLLPLELYERNLIKAINTKVMGLVRYTMMVCHYTKTELRELDMKLRTTMVEYKARNNEDSIERMYLPRKVGGRGILSFELVYNMTKILVAIYLCLTDTPSLKMVFERERNKSSWKNPVREAEIAMQEVGHSMELQQGKVVVDGVMIEAKTLRQVRKSIITKYKEWWIEAVTKEYEAK